MFTLVLVICLALRIRTVEIHLQKPVHHGIRITADRRCEMRVELESQTIMADIVSAVTCLRHRAQRQDLDRAEFRLVLRFREESVQCLGEFPPVFSFFHLISEIAGELAESVDFFQIRHVVNTIYECLGGLLRHAVHLSTSSDKLCY